MAIVPTQNPLALIGYYMGIASLIPGVGCLTGPIAIVLGVIAMVQASKRPEIQGKGHAITAIVLGFLGPFVVAAVLAVLVFVVPALS